jgi:hypothetical protein
MPIRENLSAGSSISEEELENLNNLRRSLEQELNESTIERVGLSESDESMGQQQELPFFTIREDGEVRTNWDKKRIYENFFEKKCIFLEIQTQDILNCDEPKFINGATGGWSILKVDFNKTVTSKLIEYKDLKNFDYIIDVYQNQEYIYRWVITCESILEIDFSSEEFVRVILLPKDCVVIKN